MTDTKTKRLHRIVRKLKKELPPAYKVSVNLVRKKIKHNGDECHALSWLDLDKRKFFIKIYRGDCYFCMLDSLIHEWSHILDWSHLHDMREEPEYHSATWGVWFAKVYRLVHER